MRGIRTYQVRRADAVEKFLAPCPLLALAQNKVIAEENRGVASIRRKGPGLELCGRQKLLRRLVIRVLRVGGRPLIRSRHGGWVMRPARGSGHVDGSCVSNCAETKAKGYMGGKCKQMVYWKRENKEKNHRHARQQIRSGERATGTTSARLRCTPTRGRSFKKAEMVLFCLGAGRVRRGLELDKDGAHAGNVLLRLLVLLGGVNVVVDNLPRAALDRRIAALNKGLLGVPIAAQLSARHSNKK